MREGNKHALKKRKTPYYKVEMKSECVGPRDTQNRSMSQYLRPPPPMGLHSGSSATVASNMAGNRVL